MEPTYLQNVLHLNNTGILHPQYAQCYKHYIVNVNQFVFIYSCTTFYMYSN